VSYVTATQIRDAYDRLADTEKFSDSALHDLVTEFEGIASHYRGVAFGTRTEVETTIFRVATTMLRLRWRNVRSVTSVVVTTPAVAGTVETIVSTEYTHDAELGVLSYPGGFASAAKGVITYTHGLGYRVLVDGVSTSGSATITSASGAFTVSDVGVPISGVGIPGGARIVALNSATSIDISAVATASGTGLTVSIVDPALARACREYVRASALANQSGVSRDVISQSVEGVSTRFSTPDVDAGRPTGYVDVDRLLSSLTDYRVPFA